MRLPNVAKGDDSQDGGQRGGVREGTHADNSAASKQTALRSSEGKWRASPQDDVTAPELVITGGNGGVKGSPRGRVCVVAKHIHHARRRPLP